MAKRANLRQEQEPVTEAPTPKETGYAKFAWIYNGLTMLTFAAFFLGVFHVIPGTSPFLPSSQDFSHPLIPYPWLAVALRVIIFPCLIFGYTFLAMPMERRAKDRILRRLPPTIWLAFLADVVAMAGGFLGYPIVSLVGLLALLFFRYRLTVQISVFDIDQAQAALAWGYGLDTGWLITVTVTQFFAVVLNAGVNLGTNVIPWIAIAMVVVMILLSFFWTRRSRNCALPVGVGLGLVMIFVQVLVTNQSGVLAAVLGLAAALSFLLALVCYVGNGRRLTARPLHTRY